MRAHLLTWARLLRAPNLFTAPGDALGGLFLLSAIQTKATSASTLVLVALASMTAYAFGILTNDLFDVAEDRQFRPERPLPSGQVSCRAALGAAVLLAALGLGLALAVSGTTLQAMLALLACILLYNGLAKRRRLTGAVVMGLCRGFNVILGAATLTTSFTETVTSPALAPALAVTVIIAVVTWLADGENSVQTPGRYVFIPAFAVLAGWFSVLPFLPYPHIFAYGAFSFSFLLAALAAGQYLMTALSIYGHEATPVTMPPVIGQLIRTLIPWQLAWVLLGNSLAAATTTVVLLLAWSLSRRLARFIAQS